MLRRSFHKGSWILRKASRSQPISSFSHGLVFQTAFRSFSCTWTHYVYETYSNRCGRKYIGVHSCTGHPESSKYMGSHTDKSYVPDKKRILATFLTREEAVAFEIECHNKFDVARNPAYANKAKQTSIGFDTTGVKRSDETRAKISAALAGEETRAKLSAARLGKAHSEESRAKMSAARLGKTHSEETRAKISAALCGRTLSEETRAKISAALCGRTLSEETRAKISAALCGRALSEETRAKLSAARLGKAHSEETRAKTSAALKGRVCPRLGAKVPEETQAQMSAARLG